MIIKVKSIGLVISTLLVIVFSCSLPADKKKIQDYENKIQNLEEEITMLDSIKTELIAENEELKEALFRYQSENDKKLKAEQARLERLRLVKYKGPRDSIILLKENK